MKKNEIITENYDMEDDEYMKAELSDTRRPRLTIRHLNKLRKLKDARTMQDQERSGFVKKMYGAASTGDGGDGGMEF
jgi:hypothetical protein